MKFDSPTEYTNKRSCIKKLYFSHSQANFLISLNFNFNQKLQINTKTEFDRNKNIAHILFIIKFKFTWNSCCKKITCNDEFMNDI